ncbi:hypothetical protein LX32DRAFT_313584 [Colletotrichum zoysiae]|uniref:Uncharacterized protein n=1 Tax=Colletotrichum zoysiae TaxID=1216348 RepID=A0AAD9HKM8_9PEZI|nr:hypothetical protein LX32DRAFT_313584 [Colletotrichum zoysiae]
MWCRYEVGASYRACKLPSAVLCPVPRTMLTSLSVCLLAHAAYLHLLSRIPVPSCQVQSQSFPFFILFGHPLPAAVLPALFPTSHHMYPHHLLPVSFEEEDEEEEEGFFGGPSFWKMLHVSTNSLQKI